MLLSFDQLCNDWIQHCLPTIARKENFGTPDRPMRRESFNNFVDAYHRNGWITEEDADNFCIPDELETCSYHSEAVSQLRDMVAEVMEGNPRQVRHLLHMSGLMYETFVEQLTMYVYRRIDDTDSTSTIYGEICEALDMGEFIVC